MFGIGVGVGDAASDAGDCGGDGVKEAGGGSGDGYTGDGGNSGGDLLVAVVSVMGMVGVMVVRMLVVVTHCADPAHGGCGNGDDSGDGGAGDCDGGCHDDGDGVGICGDLLVVATALVVVTVMEWLWWS